MARGAGIRAYVSLSDSESACGDRPGDAGRRGIALVSTSAVLATIADRALTSGASLNFKVTDKAAVGQLVKDSFANCDDAFAAVTNENALEMIGTDEPTHAAVLHGNEHYGNLVTYMRMKGIVPTSSAPATQEEQRIWPFGAPSTCRAELCGRIRDAEADHRAHGTRAAFKILIGGVRRCASSLVVRFVDDGAF